MKFRLQYMMYAYNLNNISTHYKSESQLSSEQFRLSQINGFGPDNRPIHKLKCVFEDFSHHLEPCLEWDEFTKLGYGYKNIYYDDYWHNITHRKGAPCMCMCEQNYESIRGDCLRKDKLTEEDAKHYVKLYGFFPAAIFLMARFNNLYYIPGLLMSILYVCLLLLLSINKCKNPLYLLILVSLIILIWVILISI